MKEIKPSYCRDARGYREETSNGILFSARFNEEEFAFMKKKSEDNGTSLAEALRRCVRLAMKINSATIEKKRTLP